MIAHKNQPLLGIELLENEARVVLTRVKDGIPAVIRAARCPLPLGAFTKGCIQAPSLVAIALRGLLAEIGAKDVTEAIFSVAFERVVFRAFTIPAVPDAEVPVIVAGEVDHYRFLDSPRSAYDFVYLTPPDAETERTGRTVAVFGVDGEVTTGLRDVAGLLGLNIRALEPASYAMYRAAMFQPDLSGAVFALMISAHGSEIAFVYNGILVAYRRIDTGSYSAQLAGTNLEEGSAPIGFDTFQPTASDRYAPDKSLDESAKHLAVEVRRILDYLEREHPEFAVAERLEVIVDDPSLEPLSTLLGDRLSVNVILVRPLTSGRGRGEAGLDLSEREGSYYSTAYGLAMRYAPIPAARVQPIDLYAQERSASVHQVTQKNFAGSVVVSAAAVVLALMGYFLYGGQIATVNAATRRADDRSTSIRNATNAVLAQRAQHAGQYRALRREGVPLATVMDNVVTGLEPGVGLSDLTINPDLKVVATADAVSETAMLRTVQNLQHSPVLTGVSITSFQQAANAEGITFHLAAQTISMDRVRPSGQEKP